MTKLTQCDGHKVGCFENNCWSPCSCEVSGVYKVSRLSRMHSGMRLPSYKTRLTQCACCERQAKCAYLWSRSLQFRLTLISFQVSLASNSLELGPVAGLSQEPQSKMVVSKAHRRPSNNSLCVMVLPLAPTSHEVGWDSVSCFKDIL